MCMGGFIGQKHKEVESTQREVGMSKEDSLGLTEDEKLGSCLTDGWATVDVWGICAVQKRNFLVPGYKETSVDGTLVLEGPPVKGYSLSIFYEEAGEIAIDYGPDSVSRDAMFDAITLSLGGIQVFEFLKQGAPEK